MPVWVILLLCGFCLANGILIGWLARRDKQEDIDFQAQLDTARRARRASTWLYSR